MVELEQQYAVIGIPANTVEFTIIASVYLDGDIKKFQSVFNMADVNKAVREAERGYIPEDATFSLTEKGKMLGELLDKGMDWEDACAVVNKEWDDGQL